MSDDAASGLIDRSATVSGLAAPAVAESWRFRLDAWLRSERLPVWLAALSLLISSPSLGLDWQGDDALLLRAVQRGTPAWALGTVAPQDLAHARQIGALAWWSSSELTIRFLRPLACLWHYVEFTYWPSATWAMHLANIATYATMVLLATQLYRLLLPDARTAGLAALMFCIDEAHAETVGWIAARNTMSVTLFVLAALLDHIEARRASTPRLSIRSLVWLAIALLFGESGIAGFAYLLAYALLLETGTLRARLRTVLPHALVILCWTGAYVAAHGGAHGITLYRGTSAPFHVLLDGLLDLPTWLLSLFGPSVVGTSLAFPANVGRILALVLVTPLIVFVWPTLTRHRLGAFFALGTLFCLPPLFLTMPQDRLLMAASFGAFGSLACFFAVARDAGFRSRWGRRCFIAIHFVLAPLLFIPSLNVSRFLQKGVLEIVAQMRTLGGREVVLVNSPSELLMPWAFAMTWDFASQRPASFHQLYAGSAQPVVSRIDDHTLEMFVRRGWGGPPLEATVRQPMPGVPRVGDSLQLANMRVHVETATASGMPERVRFEFPTPLESNRVWLIWRGKTLERWSPPALGERVTLDALSAFTSLAH
jgi:hypothetical protein